MQLLAATDPNGTSAPLLLSHGHGTLTEPAVWISDGPIWPEWADGWSETRCLPTVSVWRQLRGNGRRLREFSVMAGLKKTLRRLLRLV